MRGLIAAVSPDNVIGVDGQLPWRYPGDLRRFKRVTLGTTVIMGRITWGSIGRPLPKRRNMVITRQHLANVECFTDIPSALESCSGDIWFIGGAGVFAEGMRYCDLLDITYVPDRPSEGQLVYFPDIDLGTWEPGEILPHEDEPGLTRRIFTRRR